MTLPGWARSYLRRLGVPVRKPSRSYLQRLHEAHLIRVPFENVDVLLGRGIALDAVRLRRRIVGGRGGVCYELNGAFAELLAALAFPIRRLSARVVLAGGKVCPPYDHLALLVSVGGDDYLADVGFAGLFRKPILLKSGLLQADPEGRFSLARAGPHWTLREHRRGGSVQDRYQFDLRPRQLEEFAARRDFHCSPRSRFTAGLICHRLAAGEGAFELRGESLTVTGGAPGSSEVGSKAEVAGWLRSYFGVPAHPVNRWLASEPPASARAPSRRGGRAGRRSGDRPG